MIQALRGLIAGALLSAAIGLRLYRDEIKAACRQVRGDKSAPI